MQRYNKKYADTQRHVKTQNIQVGDCVLVRQQRQNKLPSNFSTMLYTIIKRNKSQVTARSKNGLEVIWNISYFKCILRPNDSEVDSDTETYDKKTPNNGDQERIIQNRIEDTPPRRSCRDKQCRIDTDNQYHGY